MNGQGEGGLTGALKYDEIKGRGLVLPQLFSPPRRIED